MDHSVLQTVTVECLTARARHQRTRRLRRHPLASFPHRIFALGPIPLISPFLEIGLGPIREEHPPCSLEFTAGLVEGLRPSARSFPRAANRVEAPTPTP